MNYGKLGFYAWALFLAILALPGWLWWIVLAELVITIIAVPFIGKGKKTKKQTSKIAKND